MGGFLELVADAYKTAARGWLASAHRGLGYRIPLELLVTEVGTAEVRDLLGRIEYEVLA